MAKVARVYRCTSCAHKWRKVQEISETSECPNCSAVKKDEVRDGGIGAPMVGTVKGKAVDTAYKIFEQDYGITNMRDNQREGDIGHIAPQMDISPQVQDTLNKQGGFYANGSSVNATIKSRNDSLSMASGAKAERIAQGIKDPVVKLHSTLKKNQTPSVIDLAKNTNYGIRAR